MQVRVARAFQDLYRAEVMGQAARESISIMKGLWSMENYSTSNAHRRGRLDTDQVASPSLSVMPNKSGLLIESNCNRTEYLFGPPCVWLRLTLEGE